MELEAVIGLEVHVQLRTHTKIFCRCPNRFGAEPNTLVCPVCLGYPGTLPVINRQAVDLAVRLALALGCEVPTTSVFARKNYFYADLPKGYQISQFDQPLAVGGCLPLTSGEGAIRIHRLHLEEDAGKLLHETPGGGALPGQSLVDFNRCGVPLVEIVSEPDISSPVEAQDYLQTLHQLLLYTHTSDGNMEEGSLRCDANVSLRPRGSDRLGTKTEVKNLNSFRHVAKALEFEIERQSSIIESGGRIDQETRSFDAAVGVTRLLRTKEEAHDYRYFPEPDLGPVVLAAERIAAQQEQLPELPWVRRQRFVESLGLSRADAHLLTSGRELADYFEAVLAEHPDNPRAIANWVMTEVLRELKQHEGPLLERLPPHLLADLVRRIDDGGISNTAAKEVFAEMWRTGERPETVIDRLGLTQVRDRDQLGRWVEEVIGQHPGPIQQYREGRKQALGFLVGQVMRRSQGRADPRQVQELLQQAIES